MTAAANNRTEKAAAADFIDAGDARKAAPCAAREPYTGVGTLLPFGHELSLDLPAKNPARLLIALAQAGCFAPQSAQIVKLGAAYASCSDQIDMVDHRRVDREDALHAVTEADLSHRDGLAHPTILAREHGSFKGLQPLFITFSDSDVYANGVARPELRMRRRPRVLVDELADEVRSACFLPMLRGLVTPHLTGSRSSQDEAARFFRATQPCASA